jgi:hypothetical protein
MRLPFIRGFTHSDMARGCESRYPATGLATTYENLIVAGRSGLLLRQLTLGQNVGDDASPEVSPKFKR